MSTLSFFPDNFSSSKTQKLVDDRINAVYEAFVGWIPSNVHLGVKSIMIRRFGDQDNMVTVINFHIYCSYKFCIEYYGIKINHLLFWPLLSSITEFAETKSHLATFEYGSLYPKDALQRFQEYVEDDISLFKTREHLKKWEDYIINTPVTFKNDYMAEFNNVDFPIFEKSRKEVLKENFGECLLCQPGKCCSTECEEREKERFILLFK